MADNVGCALAFLNKEHVGTDRVIHEIYGASVKGKICLINDDIMDTGTTIIKATDALFEAGAAEVWLSATHAVFGDKDGTTAYRKLKSVGVKVVVTDSIRTKKKKWLTVLPLARYMGQAILQNIIAGGSVSTIITKGLPKAIKNAK